MARVDGRKERRHKEEEDRNVFMRFMPQPDAGNNLIAGVVGVGVPVSYKMYVNCYDMMAALWRNDNWVALKLFSAARALTCAFMEVPNPERGNRHHNRLKMLSQPFDHGANRSNAPEYNEKIFANASEVDDFVNGVADTMFYSADKVNS